MRSAAVRFLIKWAEASVTNCSRISEAQAGSALATALMTASRHQPQPQLCLNVTQAMSTLARGSPNRSVLRIRNINSFLELPGGQIDALDRSRQTVSEGWGCAVIYGG